MNLPSDQDCLEDLPQVLFNRANISSSRSLFEKSEPLNSSYCLKLDNDDIVVDSTLVQVTKSEVSEINSLVACEEGLDVENPNLFEKDCFKFATQCPEISSQKRERRSYGGNKIARRLREPPLNMAFPSKLLNYELKILKQPEEQHRARYLTEGSRGTVKDKTGQGHPTVKLIGYDQPVVLQVFVGSDSGKIKPHGFYQACKVSHKNSSACVEKEIDGTAVIELPVDPKSEMTTVVDCVGILKLRNADVEQRIGLAKSKKKSTVARLVFRVNIPKSDSSYHTLQISSTPILCTQPTGAPEISKKSLNQSSARGGEEMFIIGKNFMKGTTVYFEEVRDHKVVWSREADIDQDFFQSTHLVCTVPPYLDLNIKNPVEAQIVVNSSNRTSEPVTFTYLPYQSNEVKSFGNQSNFQSETSPFQSKCQSDGGYLKRSYALSDVSPGEIDGSTFLNGSDDKSHLSDASISLEGILPSASPHLNSAPLMASPLILLPKDITPQQNTILDNINTNMLASNFNDDLSFADESVNLSLAMAGEDSLKHELTENGEPCFKRLAQNIVSENSNLQAFIEMVSDKSSPKTLSELEEQKSFAMMWSQDLNKSNSLNNQSITGENLNFAQDLHSYSSPAPQNLTNSPDNLILKYAESPKDPIVVEKTFLTLTPLPGSSGIMETFPENMTFIHNLAQSKPSHPSPSNQMFLMGNNGSPSDPTPILTDLGSSSFMKLDEINVMKMDGMNIDREQNFHRDFLLSEKIIDAGMGCNLQESLSELKNLTSKVGVSSTSNQDEKPLSNFLDQNIVTHMINVEEKFIYPASNSDAPQPMSASEPSGVFESNSMGSFPTLSTSYDMVADLRNFGDELRAESRPASECITGMSYDDKSMLSLGLMDQDVKNSSSFSMMETHSNTQNLPMSHHINVINESLYLPHGNAVDIGSVFRTNPEGQQVFSDKSLDQSMAIQFESGVHQACIIADSGDNKSKSELFYLLTEEMPANILAPLTQQNQISPLPNLTVEEVSQVLNMSGS